MKKACPIILFIVFCPLIFCGQKAEIGIKTGVSLNKFYGEPLFNKVQDKITGYFFGAELRWKLENNLSLGTGLLYQRTGSMMNDLEFTDNLGNTIAYGDWKQKLDYLAVPAMVHFSFGTKNAFSLGAGLFGAYLLSAKGQLANDSININFPASTDISDNYEKMNFGLVGTASYRFSLPGNKSLLLGFEEYLGLKNINRSETAEKIKTHSYGFFASLLVGFKK